MENNIKTTSTIKYAGFWVRVAAYCIDVLVLIGFELLIFCFYFVTGSFALGAIIFSIVILFYAPTMIVLYQATLGKMAVGLRVERSNGERVGFGRAFLREILIALSGYILFIGFITIPFTEKRQGLHDIILDTVVVENDPSKSKTGWIVFAVMLSIIPLIGIFSAIVLTNLNSAKQKANDVIVKKELMTVKLESVLYYDGLGHKSYLGYCKNTKVIATLASASKAGTVDKNTVSSVCNDNKTAWAASSPLRAADNFACVDSTSQITIISSPLTDGETSCN